ncbi:MAG: hypothetical protein WA798_05610, partial [Candidatus Acidiferrum sp.]
MTEKLSKHVETRWLWPTSILLATIVLVSLIIARLTIAPASQTIVVEHVWTQDENAALDDARATCLALPDAPACVALLPPNGPQPAVGLYWFLDADPTTGAGMAAPLYQLLVRTDTPSIYYKSGTANTAWTLIGTSSGGGGGGTVTSITCGTGLTCTPTPITTTGSVAITNTAVTPATYTNATVTVNQQGQVTAASSGTAPVTGAGTSPDLTAWSSASTVGDYGGSSPSACSAGSVTTDVALSAAGALTNTCTAIGTAGGITGTGTSPDLMVWASSTSATNYAGSTPAACTSGQAVTQPVLSAAGALTATCTAIHAINGNEAIFGNGVDGADNFTGTGGTVAGATLSGSTYTMQRSIFCNGCTVSTGVTIKENGFTFQDAGTLTLSGTANINDNGASAVTTTAGATRGAQWFGGTAAGGNTASVGGS